MKCFFNVSSRDFVNLKLVGLLERKEFWKILQEIVQFAVDVKFAEYIEAEPYERTKLRKTYRNGYRKKTLITSEGSFTISIPKSRKGCFFPDFLTRYQHILDALICVIQEAYKHGVSTRNIESLYKGLISEGLSKSTISRMNQKLWEKIDEFNNRPLLAKYRYIWIDGKFTSKRHNNRKQSVVILHALGMTFDGKKESLGFYLADKENEANWRAFLKSLKSRGLEECWLWIRDEHQGLVNAISEVFPGQAQQRCLVHWMRNVLDSIKAADQSLIKVRLKEVNQSLSSEGFADAIRRLNIDLELRGYPDLVEGVERSQYDIASYLRQPDSHWSKIRNNNQIERFNEELERRFKTIPIFPNDRSIELLAGSILMDYTKKWSQKGHYLITKDLEPQF